MYLSKVLLQPQGLENAWQWHRALWTLFPDRASGEALPCLYRIEAMNLAEGAQVLMQSEQKPLLESVKARVLAQKKFEPQFITGQRLRFRLQANPTKKISDQQNPKRKIRVPFIKEADQQAWIQRKFANTATIKAEAMLIRNHPPIYFRQGRRGGKIVTVHFEGILVINDPEQLNQQLRKGIGSAKSFGCGLLSLAVM
jgi:CRISPR system Cascade subunit CasE